MTDSSESAVALTPPCRRNSSAPWRQRRPVAVVGKAGRHLPSSVVGRNKDDDDKDNKDNKDNDEDDDKNKGGWGGGKAKGATR